jgi:hypothetical protein
MSLKYPSKVVLGDISVRDYPSQTLVGGTVDPGWVQTN